MSINDETLERLYRETFPSIARTVARRGGDLEAAKDIFHDALIIYMEKLQQPPGSLHASPQAYIAGIARILWIKRFNKESKYQRFDDTSDDFAIPEDFYTTEKDPSRKMFSYLQSAGKKCLELLQAFYYEGNSMQEIADKFHFKTKRSATVQKHKCIEKLRDQLKTSTIYEEAVA